MGARTKKALTYQLREDKTAHVPLAKEDHVNQ